MTTTFPIKMDIRQNFAMFQANNRIVIVESFDNYIFSVRVGTIKYTDHLDDITARTTEELNRKLRELVNG
ncbi:hypothetical protein AWB71_05288 [Caballeronia peredens]|nr:hypothetical protein AWB71_05288 [Caballeronia peredens]